jgi:hypothetical protein
VSIVAGSAPSEANGREVFGQRLATALTKERHDDDTISTLRNGDNSCPRTLGALPDAISAQKERAQTSVTRSTGSATTTSSLSITTKHTLNSRMTHMETDVGDISS